MKLTLNFVLLSSFGLKLEKRIEYLSLASVNAKSHQPSEFDLGDQGTVEFLTDLDEKLEVAYVQLDVYNVLKEKRLSDLGEDGVRAIELISTALLDVTAVSLTSICSRPSALMQYAALS